MADQLARASRIDLRPPSACFTSRAPGVRAYDAADEEAVLVILDRPPSPVGVNLALTLDRPARSPAPACEVAAIVTQLVTRRDLATRGL